MSLVLRIVSLVTMLMLHGVAARAGLIYDESISGDLPQIGQEPFPTFIVPAGINDVIGMVTYQGDTREWDGFNVEILPSHILIDIVFAFTNASLSGNAQVSGFAGIIPGAFGTPASGASSSVGWIARAPGSIFGVSSPSPISPFTTLMPLGSGTYRIYIEPTGLGGAGGSIPYTFSFNVISTAVPEPASLTLFSLGAVSLTIGAYRRRRVV